MVRRLGLLLFSLPVIGFATRLDNLKDLESTAGKRRRDEVVVLCDHPSPRCQALRTQLTGCGVKVLPQTNGAPDDALVFLLGELAEVSVDRMRQIGRRPTAIAACTGKACLTTVLGHRLNRCRETSDHDSPVPGLLADLICDPSRFDAVDNNPKDGQLAYNEIAPYLAHIMGGQEQLMATFTASDTRRAEEHLNTLKSEEASFGLSGQSRWQKKISGKQIQLLREDLSQPCQRSPVAANENWRGDGVATATLISPWLAGKPKPPSVSRTIESPLFTEGEPTLPPPSDH